MSLENTPTSLRRTKENTRKNSLIPSRKLRIKEEH